MVSQWDFNDYQQSFPECIKQMLDKVKYASLCHPEKPSQFVSSYPSAHHTTPFHHATSISMHEVHEPLSAVPLRRLHTYAPEPMPLSYPSPAPSKLQPPVTSSTRTRTNSLSHFDFPKSSCFRKAVGSRAPSPPSLSAHAKEMLRLNLGDKKGYPTDHSENNEIDSPTYRRPACTDRTPQQVVQTIAECWPAWQPTTKKNCPVTGKIGGRSGDRSRRGSQENDEHGIHKQKEDCWREGLKQTVSTLATVSFHRKCTQPLKHTSSVKKPQALSRKDLVVIKQLGTGKYSKVYMVRQRKTGFLAALKCISKERVIKENLLNQITREIKISSYVNHPNLIGFYGYFDDSENLYLLYELGCDGQLFKKLKQSKTFSEEAVAFIIRQVLQAVGYLHRNNIVHRDIKPENVVLSHGIVKLCDMGWSVHADGGEMRATMCGTPLYASPEVLQGRLYDQKIDLWAIGILAYELYFGSIPFDIKVQQDLVRIVTDDVVFPLSCDASLEFRSFIQSILRKNPSDRLSCRELLRHPFIQKYSDFETCEQVCSDEPY